MGQKKDEKNSFFLIFERFLQRKIRQKVFLKKSKKRLCLAIAQKIFEKNDKKSKNAQFWQLSLL